MKRGFPSFGEERSGVRARPSNRCPAGPRAEKARPAAIAGGTRARAIGPRDYRAALYRAGIADCATPNWNAKKDGA